MPRDRGNLHLSYPFAASPFVVSRAPTKARGFTGLVLAALPARDGVSQEQLGGFLTSVPVEQMDDLVGPFRGLQAGRRGNFSNHDRRRGARSRPGRRRACRDRRACRSGDRARGPHGVPEQQRHRQRQCPSNQQPHPPRAPRRLGPSHVPGLPSGHDRCRGRTRRARTLVRAVARRWRSAPTGPGRPARPVAARIHAVPVASGDSVEATRPRDPVRLGSAAWALLTLV